MVGWVLDAVAALDPASVTVVVGHGADTVRAVLPDHVQVAHQAEQLGTGHAAAVGLEAVDWAPGDTVVVVYGDTPMLEGPTLAALVDSRETHGATVALLAAHAPDPGRYGRIIRRADGRFERIVEFADATPTEAAVSEVNSGMYAFDAEFLASALPRLGTSNNQAEYYLTDLCADALAHHGTVEVVAMDYDEMAGVNTHVELAEAGERRRRQILRHWMLEGVAVDDPTTTYVDATVVLHPGVRLRPGTHLRGATEVGTGSEIGPDTTLVDTSVVADSLVWYAVALGA